MAADHWPLATGLAVQVRDTELLSRALSVAEIEDEANFREKSVSLMNFLEKNRTGELGR